MSNEKLSERWLAFISNIEGYWYEEDAFEGPNSESALLSAIRALEQALEEARAERDLMTRNRNALMTQLQERGAELAQVRAELGKKAAVRIEHNENGLYYVYGPGDCLLAVCTALDDVEETDE